VFMKVGGFFFDSIPSCVLLGYANFGAIIGCNDRHNMRCCCASKGWEILFIVRLFHVA